MSEVALYCVRARLLFARPAEQGNYRGTSLIRNRTPPQDPPRTLGIGPR